MSVVKRVKLYSVNFSIRKFSEFDPTRATAEAIPGNIRIIHQIELLTRSGQRINDCCKVAHVHGVICSFANSDNTRLPCQRI